ncbi:MAG: hypothetical protein WC607_00130 [Candidatus Micrarchaeia archaeon]
MKEKLLVLAKACPEASKKYEALVCVAGLTDKGEWRRIYPIPWAAFWRGKETRFRKKHWIEYELASEKPSDHRPESRKVKFETIRELRPASYEEIRRLLEPRVQTIEELEEKGARNESLGVVAPHKIYDFLETDNKHYEELLSKKAQRTLDGSQALRLEIPGHKYRYAFTDEENGRVHELLCEDWAVGELHRKCEDYRKNGRYADEKEVFEKVKAKMLGAARKDGAYFIVGTHYRFNTFMIVGVLYPKKSDF